MTTPPSKPAGGGIGGFDDHDVDFAVGSLFGVRCWEIVPGAHQGVLLLKGQHGGVWTDGENVAVCPAGHEKPPYKRPVRGAPGCTCAALTADRAEDAIAARRGYHAWGCDTKECDCGFWGYWTVEAAPNFNPARCVLGVIEGYGRVVRGPKGFRCAKARIVAVHLAMRVLDDRGYDHPDSAMVLSAAEMALAESYPSVPAYATVPGMLAMHPPTLDYLPPGERPKPCKRPEPVPPKPRSMMGVTEGVARAMMTGGAVDVPLGNPPPGWPGRIIGRC